MFRKIIASAAFLGAVVSGSTSSHAEAIAIHARDAYGDGETPPADACNTEEVHALRQAFWQAKLVMDAIVPADVDCSDSACDNWDSPYIDNSDPGSAYREWFGMPFYSTLHRNTSSRVVKGNLGHVWFALREPVEDIKYDGENFPEEVSVVFLCNREIQSGDNGYLYTFGRSGDGENTNKEEIIYFPRFSDPDVPQLSYDHSDYNFIAGFSSRVGVIIHELMHRIDGTFCSDIGGGFDSNEVYHGPAACIGVDTDIDAGEETYTDCYWADECRQLATDDALLAIQNVENYEKFTMYVYMHAMAAQFVAITHPLMY